MEVYVYKNPTCFSRWSIRYNDPLVGWEFVRDTERLAKERNLKTVMVTNGTANPDIIKSLLDTTDAMNIDLKAFSKSYYKDVVKGELKSVMNTVAMVASRCHLELTTLVIPGLNDTEEEMRRMCNWIASLDGGKKIPLHISRYFPAYHMSSGPTSIELIYRLRQVALETLDFVYTGNC